MTYAKIGRVGEFIPRPASAADYGAWLAGAKPWQLFPTLTVREVDGRGSFNAVGVGGVERALMRWWQRSVRERSHEAVGAFALEFKPPRVTPHLHGMIAGLPGYVVRDVAMSRANHTAAAASGDDYLWREWYRERVGGFARIDVIEDAEEVAAYVAKYMLKDLGKMYLVGKW